MVLSTTFFIHCFVVVYRIFHKLFAFTLLAWCAVSRLSTRK